MDQEKYQFMTLRRTPGRLTAEESSWYLGFSLSDISILVGAGLLKPLGKPAPNAIRYFARSELDHLAEDAKWLDRACATLSRHWRERNERLTRKKPEISPKSRLDQSQGSSRMKGIKAFPS
ncbi:MAG TPA: hypothetical protein VGZ93_11545 [Candidatus Methylacidiphilales bacterium]|jgi:hypothetical protein|nr:hypothetical protein [Candidatus Methylacidiphilales bacterium]